MDTADLLTEMPLCGDLDHNTGSICTRPEGHEIHANSGVFWPSPQPNRPEPALTVVRARCATAMAAARRHHNDNDATRYSDLDAMAAAVPDIPILLTLIDRLIHDVADLHIKVAQLDDANTKLREEYEGVHSQRRRGAT